jgi:NADPH:quinone reductase-like Zn-dependent oxidoreductase
MSGEAISGGRNSIDARALWIEAPRIAKLRKVALNAPRDSEALVAMQWSCISRGTERLVFEGRVPASEFERMRAPLQEGDFTFPLKYGYCAVGRVVEGPPGWLDRQVFCLHPHQNFFLAPLDMLRVLPATTPPRRATLAANVETALNALWDSGAGLGDRIVVIGAGVVGLLVCALAARLPGAEVTVVDREPSRATIADTLGVRFIEAREFEAKCQSDADVVFHTSASEAGLSLALACAGLEATVVELSWYGDAQVAAPLGRGFHANRLRLISSQVGHVSPSRRPRWPYARRLDKALELLADARLDALISEEVAFEDLPSELPRLLAADAPGLAPVVRY